MTLPLEAYPPDELASLEQAIKDAQEHAKQSTDTQDTKQDLGDIAATASKILDIEQQASDPEAIRAKLQQKIQTMAEQVYGSLPDGPDKDAEIQALVQQFSIEPSDEDPNNLVINYYENGKRSNMLLLDRRYIQGELAIPAELRITELFCEYSQLTSLAELPVSLQVLFCDGNQLTSLPELPIGLKDLICDVDILDESTKAMLKSRGFY